MTGRLNFSACFIKRNALRYPSGLGEPKLRSIFSGRFRPFWIPTTVTGFPCKVATPPTTAKSSAK